MNADTFSEQSTEVKHVGYDTSVFDMTMKIHEAQSREN